MLKLNNISKITQIAKTKQKHDNKQYIKIKKRKKQTILKLNAKITTQRNQRHIKNIKSQEDQQKKPSSIYS